MQCYTLMDDTEALTPLTRVNASAHVVLLGFFLQNNFILYFSVESHRHVHGRTNFQLEICLTAASSIHFQPLVAQKLLIFNKFMLPSFTLIWGRSYVFIPFLSRFVLFQKTVATFWNLNLFMKSFKIPLIFFLSVRLKLIPPSQINSFVFLNTVYFEGIVMHVVEDYFSM